MLFLYCRAGFEDACAAEISELAASQGVHGFCKAKPGAAYVVFQSPGEGDGRHLHTDLHLDQLVFARQWFVAAALRNDLSTDDRITPLLEVLQNHLPGPVGELFIETPDTNEAKALSALCRRIEKPFRRRLQDAGFWREQSPWRLHVCFLSTHAAYIGYADARRNSPWPMGIPRLRFPTSAPSRSTLKLEEALLLFLDPVERESLLRPGLEAVDLGAAPGGWTWQLVRRGLQVVAVDNGPMDQKLMASGSVIHVREDGFRYRPERPVEWMVCDMIERPIRVAELAAQWIGRGWCRRTIFNLKLPMKKRHREVIRCRGHIDEVLRGQGVTYTMQCKQLYHDREEITCYLVAR